MFFIASAFAYSSVIKCIYHTLVKSSTLVFWSFVIKFIVTLFNA